MKKKLPKSLRKYIRQEKTRIRREVLDLKKQEEKIQKLYEEIFQKLKIKNYANKRNLPISNKNRN